MAIKSGTNPTCILIIKYTYSYKNIIITYLWFRKRKFDCLCLNWKLNLHNRVLILVYKIKVYIFYPKNNNNKGVYNPNELLVLSGIQSSLFESLKVTFTQSEARICILRLAFTWFPPFFRNNVSTTIKLTILLVLARVRKR